MNQPSSSPQALQAQLADRLSPENAHKVATALFEAGRAGHVSELLNELQERSAKLAGQAMDALPEMVERCGPEPVSAAFASMTSDTSHHWWSLVGEGLPLIRMLLDHNHVYTMARYALPTIPSIRYQPACKRDC